MPGDEQAPYGGNFRKVKSDHKGELRFSVLHDPIEDVVFVQFSDPVSWLTLPPAEARALANTLICEAEKLEQTGDSP